jgi:hypothetical protein
MAETEVILSDGEPCVVRRLGVFDLDGKGPKLPGTFKYTFKDSDGREITEEYDPSRRKTPPMHPGIPEHEIVERSPQWWALLEWETYKAAAAHETNVRLPATATYVMVLSYYVAQNCVSSIDITRIQTEEDWDQVYQAAIVPQITTELLARAFKDHFGASFNDEELFDAVKKVRHGSSKMDSLRLWEMDAMAKFGYKTEDEWADLSLDERVRKVSDIAMPQVMETLEADKRIREMERTKNAA